MNRTTAEQRRQLESLDRDSLRSYQLARLNQLLRAILPQNAFYAQKLAGFIDANRLADPSGPLHSLDELAALPQTFKDELQILPPGELAANLTWPLDRYTRLHQTSGTRGRPLVVLDTADDWQWWMQCWDYVLDAAGVLANDRVFMAFSFGPFIGFWSAHDAACSRGCLVVPGGGMNTQARLEMIRTTRATVIFCTPNYALHLAEVGLAHQIDVAQLGVRKIILAGEPGGSIAPTRARIAADWQAEVFDHAGASEIGPWGFADVDNRGLHVMETEFIAELLSLRTGEPAAEGELAELVLTNLGRVGYPVIRYRTGDLVRATWSHSLTNRFVLLDGGVLGRTDDMMIIRGVNIFPSSIEQILRSFPEVVEYRLTVRKAGQMDQLLVEIEDHLNQPQRVADELRLRLGLKVDVAVVPALSLPRFEGKARRFVDER